MVEEPYEHSANVVCFTELEFAAKINAIDFFPAPIICEMEEHRNLIYLGSEYESLENVGLADCITACLDRPNCRSLDHVTGNGENACFLNDVSHMTAPNDFYHYENEEAHYMYKVCT